MTAKTRAELEAQFTDQPFGSGGRKQYRQVDNGDLRDLLDSIPLATEGAAADFSAVAEDILPDADDTYDLGSAVKRWASINGHPIAEVLVDPGAAWQATHVYSLGDRFRETVDGEVRVFEITVAGTSGGGVFADYGADLVPLADWGSGTETWIYIGIVGQVSWMVTPFLGGGLSLGPQADNGHALIYTTTSATEDSGDLFALRATVAGVPVAVLEINTDGDGDHFLNENAGAGMRWWVSDGVSGEAIAEITYEHFKTFSKVVMADLPTVNPASLGQLWNDGGTLKVSAG